MENHRERYRIINEKRRVLKIRLFVHFNQISMEAMQIKPRYVNGSLSYRVAILREAGKFSDEKRQIEFFTDRKSVV